MDLTLNRLLCPHSGRSSSLVRCGRQERPVSSPRCSAAVWRRRKMRMLQLHSMELGRVRKGVEADLAARCVNGRFGPLLWKNTCSRAQNLGARDWRRRLSCQALRICCGAGRIFASFRRFWAVAASRNSSFAPHGPRSRSLPRPSMRLSCANSTSTFLRSFIETAYCSVPAMSRATWRASSCSSRVRDLASALGQHCCFDVQA